MKRLKLSSLRGNGIAKLEHDERGYLLIRNASGHVIAMVQPDDLFDADGNRFEDDVED